MESSSNQKNRTVNPFDQSNFFQKLFFIWVTPLLRDGGKKEIEESDLPQCPSDHKSFELTSRLEREWFREVDGSRRTNKKPSLLRCLFRVHGCYYAFLVIAVIFEEAGRSTNPILLSYLLLFFRPASPLFISQSAVNATFQIAASNLTNQTGDHMLSAGISLREACFYALGVVLASLFSITIHHYYLFCAERIGMEIKIASMGIMYRKVLRLSSEGLGKASQGKIQNLMSNDVATFNNSMFTPYLVVGPLHAVATLILLYFYIGWSALISSAVIIMFVLFQMIPSSYFAKIRIDKSRKTDKRVQQMDEIIKAMKIIKMYCWEKPFSAVVKTSRREELAKLWTMKKAMLITFVPYYLARYVYVLVIAVSTIYLSDFQFTSSYLFMVITLSNVMLVSVTYFFGRAVFNGSQCIASVQRIQEFLELEERTGLRTEEVNQESGFEGEAAIPLLSRTNPTEDQKPGVTVNHLSARWPGQEINPLTDINFTVRPGELVAVVGPVGAGKSSLLMSILGECPHTNGSVDVKGSIGYSSQDSWIFSSTLRQNILFGREYNSDRLDYVLRLTTLQQDVDQLPYGNQSLVGDRGTQLSGGQKARVSLSRAIYKRCDIYLLDDPLSAVDTTVARHIFDRCIRGELMDSAVILVTHQLHFIQQATKIIVLKDGHQLTIGTYSELCESGVDFTELLQHDEKDRTDKFTDEHSSGVEEPVAEVKDRRSVNHRGDNYSIHSCSSNSDSSKSDENIQRKANIPVASTSLITGADVKTDEPKKKDQEEKPAAESRASGTISPRLYVELLRHGANYCALIIVTLLFISSEVGLIMSDWWITQWAALNEFYESKREEIPVNDTHALQLLEANLNSANRFYSLIQAAIVVVVGLLAISRTLAFQRVFIRASQKLHYLIFKSLLRAPMSFFDTNPAGRIKNRFSSDMGMVDDAIPSMFNEFIGLGLIAIGALLTTIVILPWMLLFIIPTIVAMVLLRRYYISTSRQMKRLEGTTNSPVYNYLDSTITGLYSIRAFNSQAIFFEEFSQHQDVQTTCVFLSLCTNKWLGILLDLLCVLLIGALAYGLILSKEYLAVLNIDSLKAGLSLTYMIKVLNMIQFVVRMSGALETFMTSYERVKEYSELPQEAESESTDDMNPPTEWPEHGRIQINRASLKYREDSPTILKNITLDIRPAEKIGIVGRTGAGKSSLLSMLFRLCEPDGEILIDGINISHIGLDDLRRVMSIIPQDPVLFNDTIRYNLDPFTQYTDEQIWTGLEQVHMADYIQSLSDQLLALVEAGGSNFSVGQRQLLCLARCILSRNRIIIVDEATANVDTRTDALIQTTLREQFQHCTVLTIAHRLDTIMDSDRILVLYNGQVVEFDSAANLQQNEDGHFSELVKQMRRAQQNSTEIKNGNIVN